MGIMRVNGATLSQSWRNSFNMPRRRPILPQWIESAADDLPCAAVELANRRARLVVMRGSVAAKL
jgi:hypothetical protein